MQEVRYIKIEEPLALKELILKIENLNDTDMIALDTEFERVSTLYPILGLLQLKVLGTNYLIDPKAVEIKELIYALVNTKALVLVFAGDEDLEIIVKYAKDYGFDNLLPRHICDIQVLAAFSNFLYGKGLMAFVKEIVGTELEKSYTRTDWLARPLSENQLIYAALDVEYLEDLYKFLLARLDATVLSFFKEEMNLKRNEAMADYDPKTAYRSVKGAGLLNHEALVRLQYICQKRMEFALLHNFALNHVITTGSLCDLAQKIPLTKQGLASCKVKWGAIRENGDQIIEWIKESIALPVNEDLPLPFNYFAHKRELKDAFKSLRRFLHSKAIAFKIAPELLDAKKYVYDFFLNRYLGQKTFLQSNWREQVTAGLEKLSFPPLRK